MQNLMNDLKKLFEKDDRIFVAGTLFKNKLTELALKNDQSLIELLLSDRKAKKYFFIEKSLKEDKVFIFDKDKFISFINNKKFLPDSFTAFKNKISLLELSVIIPVKTEEQNIAYLAAEINEVMKSLPYLWECIWVDDGSTDNTLAEIQRINGENPHHQYVTLSRNYGQSAAMYTGFRHANGNILITLDGDGQNDPRDIPRLVQCLVEQNLDMVNGVRQKRQDDFVRKFSSKIANSFRNWITNEKVKDVGCSLRIFRRECVENIIPFKGMHRFLPTLIRICGYSKIVEIPVRHRPRKYGKTSYGIQNRLWIGIWDTLAVRWMQKRIVFSQVKSTSLDKKRNKKT